MTEYNSTKTVDAIGKLNFEGNVIPHSWYKVITKTTPKGTTKPDTIGIILLSDIVYWYRPTIIRDESTGNIIKIKKKFKADKLQRSYDQLSEQFGFSKRQVRDAIYRLKDLGLLEIEFRNIKVNGVDLNNILYLEPIPENINKATFPHTYDEKKEPLLRKKVTGGTKNSSTNTEITTENTTEITIDVENQTSSILNEDQNQNTETIKASNAGNKEVTLKSEHSGIEDSFIPVWVNSEEEVPPMNDVHLGHLAKESKRKAKMEEHFKNKSIPDLVAWDKERVRKGEKQKSKGGAKAKTSPLNSSVIIARFNELYNSFFSETTPLVEIKHKTLMKKMIEHYGYEYTEAMLLWMFENWAEFKRECKLKSTPNLSILYSFRDYLQEKVRNRVEETGDLHEF